MEDKQIIELYWNRSDDAIKETTEKYGQECAYIASHILQNVDKAEVCAKESLQVLWETIPPHRPQNLKAYVCKITRNHALQMKYPDFMEQDVDLFSAELVIHDFLKELEPEQRKLFIAHYWYFVSVAEIAVQYKMSENKGYRTLDSLRQKLDNALEEKQISFISEEELFFAMTEVEDRYLEEAEPLKIVHKEPSEETGQDTNQNTAILFSHIWKKFQIPIIACTLFLIVVVVVWSKNSLEQNPPTIESELSEGSGQDSEKTELDILLLTKIVNGEIFSEETFEYRKSTLPWEREMEIAALPIYKNLAYVDVNGYRGAGYSIFLDEDTLVAMAEDIAAKLNMQVIDSTVQKVNFSDEMLNVVHGIEVTTDLGSIQIKGNGQVDVKFFEGVQLPEEYKMSDSATIANANKTVAYLLETYADVIPTDKLVADCYDVYDKSGNRSMKYQAVGRAHGADGIVEYYFNQVGFDYNEQLGLTGISYGDVRAATELLGYYPIISVEEAKNMLIEGDSIHYDMAFSSHEVLLSDLRNTSYVELVYYVPNQQEYISFIDRSHYLPYYCFYVKLGDTNEYCRYYVPAVEGATVDRLPTETAVTILDMKEYDIIDGLYFKDGKYYTLQNGEIVETEPPVANPTEDPYMEYGEVIGDIQDNGAIQWNFYYKGELLVNLDKITAGISSINPASYEARYVDGNIVIICRESREYESVLNDYAIVLLYLTEDGTIRKLTDAIPMRSSAHPYGLNLEYDIYATMGNESEEVQILDLRTGESVNTGILYEDIEYIVSASKAHYAVLYKTGEIAVVEKASGQMIKKTKYQLNFKPSYINYQDGILYVEDVETQDLIFVIEEFE